MQKHATKIFSADCWKIVENDFKPEFNKVAESIFSLGNEFMGIRGMLDEGSSAQTLQGSYFNGIYEWGKEITEGGYKGIVKRTHYMVNSVNYFACEILVDGIRFDQAIHKTSNYVRQLDMQTGVLKRSLRWHLDQNKYVDLCFVRFLDMVNVHRAYQQIELTSNFECHAELNLLTTFDTLHWGKPTDWTVVETVNNDGIVGLMCRTATTNQYVASCMTSDNNLGQNGRVEFQGKSAIQQFQFDLKANQNAVFNRFVCNAVDKNSTGGALKQAEDELKQSHKIGFDNALSAAQKYWSDFWQNSDIVIEGDIENQQGIRFCIFQLQQTYHGEDVTHNIGAKGLTGESYSGHAFWDTETYCLPYYLLNNLTAAKSLLMFRYNTLSQARLRAQELDCQGACYPIATLNGFEACNLWQHASLQFQPTTGVAYGIWHYMQLSDDAEFLQNYGAEMLVDICRFLTSRGQWNGDKTKFGYYGVMGPDEFQMMVNHNTYTNFMAKKTFLYTLDVLKQIGQKKRVELHLSQSEIENWQLLADKMLILHDSKTQIFEQHQGYFDLPHVDISRIPATDFPLYHNWSYDRIYRNDMIKQPDVLMFLLLYSDDFDVECKRANYDFYQPRTIHESSLSPSVHSILATELGYTKQALDFFGFATRMDLDDFNRNTCEGLHTTSLAAAWLNIVYGFGGVRTTGQTLVLAPFKPASWKRLCFNLTYKNTLLKIDIGQTTTIANTGKQDISVCVYGKTYSLKGNSTLNVETN